MTVNTSSYVASHGHNPRGLGFWAFGPTSRSQDVVFVQGTFTEAKAKAKVEAKARGWTTLAVLP